MKRGKKVFEDAAFRTAASCTTGGDLDCVAVAMDEEYVAVRSTDDPENIVYFNHMEWRNFIGAVKRSSFDV
ncbi:MAG: DUF397 domain-containing protein [Patescibacteria group bacterium]